TLAPCDTCGFCERFGCHVGAKASPIQLTIPNALRSSRLEIRKYCNVCRITTLDGNATGVTYLDASGQMQEQPAELAVGAFTQTNIRLLLLSKIGVPYDPVAGT